MQSGADQVLDGQEQILAFEDQLQQIELLVNLKQVADPLLGYAEAALNTRRKPLTKLNPTTRITPSFGTFWLRLRLPMTTFRASSTATSSSWTPENSRCTRRG